MAEKKPKIKDTQPTERIRLPFGGVAEIIRKFGTTKTTAQKYLNGLAEAPEAKARAKKIREYALNHYGQYIPRDAKF